MNIGTASRRSGLPAKTIRYYEELGLVVADRLDNSYRDYSAEHIHKLSFLRRARHLGFSIEECRHLLSLYEDNRRTSAEVKEIATSKLGEIDEKIAELMELRDTLAHLVDSCHGDQRPDCPILKDLAGETS